MPKRWEFKELPLDEDGNPPPFSKMNLKMMALSTQYACEQMGLTNGHTPLSDGMRECILHPDKMTKG